MPPGERDGADTSQSVDRAMTLLWLLAERGPQRQADLVRLTGLQRRILARFLASLEQAGLVRRSPRTGQYDLGIALPQLGRLAEERLALPRVAAEPLRELMTSTASTVLLHMRQGDYLAPATVANPPGVLSVNYPAGRRIALWEGLGRAFLACLQEGEQRRLSGKIAGETLHEIGEELRRDGYVVSRSMIDAGITAVGAIIADSLGQPVGLIAVVAAEAQQPEQFGPQIAEAAQVIAGLYNQSVT
jgi:DNA-binding IclR family transcriptional regulator